MTLCWVAALRVRICSTQPDALKETLERIEKHLIESFDAEDRAYFDKEFEFFNRVTGISGALKPYIRRPKSERKVRRRDGLE